MNLSLALLTFPTTNRPFTPITIIPWNKLRQSTINYSIWERQKLALFSRREFNRWLIMESIHCYAEQNRSPGTDISASTTEWSSGVSGGRRRPSFIISHSRPSQFWQCSLAIRQRRCTLSRDYSEAKASSAPPAVIRAVNVRSCEKLIADIKSG